MSDRLLRTKQVGELLGLSDSTVKRLVNSGALKAVRTQGGHRLVPESEVRSYLDRLEREAGIRGLAGSGAGGSGASLPFAEHALLTALIAGDAATARGLIGRAYGAGGAAPRLADELIRPVMHRIGHAWELKEIDIYEEHRATRIVESALMELIRRSPPPGPSAPLALGAAPEGDLYTLSGLLGELGLRELGWDVVNLGPNLPLASFGRAVRVHQPRLAWLSVHHLPDPERFCADYRLFYESASRTGTAIALGGPALSAELRARLVAASFGDRMAHLCEFARRLVPVTGASDGSLGRQGSTHP